LANSFAPIECAAATDYVAVEVEAATKELVATNFAEAIEISIVTKVVVAI
jgi:hypothetical protein